MTKQKIAAMRAKMIERAIEALRVLGWQESLEVPPV
jgi:DNA-binding transcriptional regulator YdaS (Cro superfamily)